MQGCFLTGDDIAAEAAEANNFGDVRKTRLRPFRNGVDATDVTFEEGDESVF